MASQESVIKLEREPLRVFLGLLNDQLQAFTLERGRYEPKPDRNHTILGAGIWLSGKEESFIDVSVDKNNNGNFILHLRGLGYSILHVINNVDPEVDETVQKTIECLKTIQKTWDLHQRTLREVEFIGEIRAKFQDIFGIYNE